MPNPMSKELTVYSALKAAVTTTVTKQELRDLIEAAQDEACGQWETCRGTNTAKNALEDFLNSLPETLKRKSVPRLGDAA